MSQPIIERIANEMRAEGCWAQLDAQTRLNESHRRLRLAQGIGLLAETDGSTDAGGDVFEAKAQLGAAGHEIEHQPPAVALQGNVPHDLLPAWRLDGELLLNKKELVAYAAAKAAQNGNGATSADTAEDDDADVPLAKDDGEDLTAENGDGDLPEQVAGLAILPLGVIRTDGGTQARAGLDEDTVSEYTQAMEEGATFPPADVYHDGEAYWLADGFHRVAARRRLGAQFVSVTVHQGTRRDAILHAAGANANHGLRRSNDDKRRAVVTLLQDEEWGQWSDREIARRCNVSHPFVAKVRGELAELSGNASRYNAPRKVERAGKVYEMETAGINAGREEEDDREPVPIPDELPEAQEVTVTEGFFEKTVAASYSGDRISNGKIKQPFEWEGGLYICTGTVSQGGDRYEASATRVVPANDWPGRPRTLSEVADRAVYGPARVFGQEVACGSARYVMDPRERITFRPARKFAPTPGRPVDIGDGDKVDTATGGVSGSPAYVPVWQLERKLSGYLHGKEDAHQVLARWKDEGMDDDTWQAVFGGEQVRLRDVLQAINNLLEQLRQKDEEPATEAERRPPADTPMPLPHRAFPVACPISGMSKASARVASGREGLAREVTPNAELCQGCPNYQYTSHGSYQCGHPSHVRALDGLLEPTARRQLLQISVGRDHYTIHTFLSAHAWQAH